MSEPEIVKFSDKERKPDDQLIASIIGEHEHLWKQLKNWMASEFPGSEGDWNYYNDGKQWVFKMTFKKKTLFWAVILTDSFRVTFYFGGKAEPVIDASDIPEVYKESFKFGKRYGQIRAISVNVLTPDDLTDVKKLVAIKKNLK